MFGRVSELRMLVDAQFKSFWDLKAEISKLDNAIFSAKENMAAMDRGRYELLNRGLARLEKDVKALYDHFGLRLPEDNDSPALHKKEE